MAKTKPIPPASPGVEPPSAPGFWRCMAAVLYDFLLLLALLFLATAILLPINNGQAFTAKQFFYPIYLLAVSFLFYGWFWTHGGQTLGLRAWKIKLSANDGHPISWRLAGLRFGAALLSWIVFGGGFLWILLDKNKRSWHDHLSKTSLHNTTT